jgi:hypothetical protein
LSKAPAWAGTLLVLVSERTGRYQAAAIAVCGAEPGKTVKRPWSSLPKLSQLTSR